MWAQTVDTKAADTFVSPGGSPFAVGTNPLSLAVADFNNDGKADVVVVNEATSNVTVLLGNGNGGFTATGGSPIATGTFPYSVAVGDFNGDGNEDFAVANLNSESVSVFLGNGTGGFSPASGSPFAVTAGPPSSVAVGDFNGDGIADLAFGNNLSNKVSVLLGNGTGGFTPASGSPFAAGNTPFSVTIGDFNGDGKPDLAIANFGDNNVTVLLGDGTGGFTAASGSPFAVGTAPRSVTTGDFNGDGKLDIVAVNEGSGNVTILLGNGAGGFTAASFPVGTSPFSAAVGDFNADGKLDLAVANDGSHNVTVLLGDGTGKFTEESGSPFAAGNSPGSIAVADFNGDGRPDLAIADAFGNNVPILLGTDAATQLKITQQPSMGTAGSPVGSVVVQVQDTFGNLISGSTATVTVSSTPSGVGGTISANAVGGIATFSNLVFSAANNYTVTASSPGLTASNGSTIQIALASQSISFGSLSNVVYGTAPFTLSASATSGLAVNFASTTQPVCTVSGNTVTLVAAGQCTIQATQTGNATYAAATAVIQNFQVMQASQTISFGALANELYGAAPFTLSATATSGLTVGFVSTTTGVCTVSGSTVTLVGPGTCTIQTAQAGNGNYLAAVSVIQSFLVTQPTTTTLSVSPNPAVFGSLVTLTATVSPSSAIGTVTFYSGTTVLGVISVSSGIAIFTTAQLSFGAGSLTARFVPAAGAPYISSLSALWPQTVNAQQAGGFTAANGSPFPTGSYPYAVAVGDFNGDGTEDLAVANLVSSNVTVLLGDGNGGFTAPSGSPFAAGSSPVSLAVGDFNSDGNADLAIANNGSNNVTVLLGDGHGGFTAASGSPFAAGTNPYAVVVGDFNGDGYADFAVANQGDNTVTVLLGNGRGGFTAASGSPFAVGTSPVALAIGDFNGDGNADLAVANDGLLTVLLGDGHGGFAAAPGSPFAAGSGADSIAVGDFNGDGKADLAIGTVQSASVTVLLGNGNGGFAAAPGSPFGYPGGYGSVSVAVGDFNGDGKADLIVVNGNGEEILEFLGDGNGGFSLVSQLPYGSTPRFVVVGDFNRDGRADLAIAIEGAERVAVLLGTDVATKLQLTQQPSNGTAGSAIGSVVVQVLDGYGNLLTGSNAPVTITSNPAGVSGTLTVNAVGGVATFNNLVFPAENTYTLTASSPGLMPGASSSIQIALASQSITFSALSSQVYGTAPITISASVSSGLTVSFASTTQAVCTVSGNTVTLVSGGLCTIQATQTGNSTYAAAPAVIQSFQVTQASQMISFGSLANVISGAAPFTVSATATSGLNISFISLTTSVCTVSGTTVTLLSVGTCTIQAAQAGNGNYFAATVVNESFLIMQPTTTGLTVTPNPAAFGSLVTLTATVSPSTATGSVTFYNGTTVLATVSVSSGTAIFTTTLLSSGSGSLAARFEGGAGSLYSTSLSLPTAEVVSSQQAGGFTPANGSPITVGAQPMFVAIGDFNGDNKADVAVLNLGSDTVTILLGDGNGGFTVYGSPVSVGGSPSGMTIGDFNGDGKVDLAVANSFTNNVTILLGNGSGGFTPTGASPITVGNSPFSVAAGDFNGDGIPDLAIADYGSNDVTVLLGDGHGGFTAVSGSPFTVGTNPDSVAVGDFNSDGKPDLAVASRDGHVTILLGNGAGGFAPASGSLLTAGTTPSAVIVADLNGDEMRTWRWPTGIATM